jgi:hypothetical protein
MSSLMAKPDTRVWNVNAEQTPFMRNLNVKDNKVYEFIQSASLGIVLSSSNTVFQGYSKAWTTSDIPQFSNFATIFDQYRFIKVEVWLNPIGPATAPGYSPPNGSRFISVTDYDDANTVGSSGSLLQYENSSAGSLQMGHYRSFRPHMAVAAYGNSVFTSFKNTVSDWIDCGSTTVQHYGIKCGVDATNSSNDFKIEAFTRVTIQFRNVF